MSFNAESPDVQAGSPHHNDSIMAPGGAALPGRLCYRRAKTMTAIAPIMNAVHLQCGSHFFCANSLVQQIIIKSTHSCQ